jgi:pilus assembly protein CpaB
MKRRTIGIVVAVVLALIGTIILVAYVESAKDDAAEGDNPVSVYVVTDAIEQGTSVADLRDRVERTEIPGSLKAADAITDIDQLDQSFITSIDLVAGEQLISSRIVAAEALVSVSMPAGYQEVSVALEPERANGGRVSPGDLVGIVLSFDTYTTVATTETGEAVTSGQVPYTSHLTLNQVLVTNVRYSVADSQRVTDQQNGDAGTPTVDEAPSAELIVTFAVTAPEAEQLVFAAEFGSIWLTAQNTATDPAGTRILTVGQVYATVERV